MGGFWAVSVTDTIQGLLMALAAIILPVFTVIELGGIGALVEQLGNHYTGYQLSFTGEFVVGQRLPLFSG